MDVFNYTVNALHGMISPIASNHERQSFQAFLIQLKESQECSAVLCNILSRKKFDSISTQELEAMFVLALSILHDWMKQWWNTINQQDQYQIRQIGSQLLSQSTDMIHSVSYCNKLAALLADLVERQYPQYWPSFISDVKLIWMQGPAFKQEIILKTMQFVLEDCTDSDFNTQLSAKRSEEILDGLRSSQDDILDISFQYFMINMAIAVEPHSNPSQVMEAKKCVSSLLKFLQVMTLIVPNDSLLRSNRNFLWLAIKGLSIDGIQVQSISSIEAIVDRPIAFDDLVAAVELLYSTEKRIYLPNDICDRIQFIHSYINTISRILSLNTDNLFHENAKMAGKADSLFQDLLTSMKQPQRRVFTDVASDLLKVFKHPSAVKYKSIEMVSKLLLEAFFEKALKPSFIVDEQLDEEEWFEIEFDDREDWHSFYNTINAQTLTLATVISEKFPIAAIQFLGEKIQQICEYESLLVNAITANASNQRAVKELRTKFLELKSQVWLLHHIFQQSFSNIVEALSVNREAELVHAMQLVQALWNWNAKGNYTFRQRLRLLAHCYPMFNKDQQPLFAFIELLISILNSTRQEKSNGDQLCTNNGLSSDMIALSSQFLLIDSRDDAAACLSLLIQKCPNVFSQDHILMPMLQSIANMMNSPQTTHHSQESMRDALVVLSTYLANPTIQKQILDIALIELINKISDILTEVFVSPEVILQAIITPVHSGESLSADPTSQKLTTSTIFLDRANKLRVLIQGFLNSMSKVEKTAIGNFSSDDIFPDSVPMCTNNKRKGGQHIPNSKKVNNTPTMDQLCNGFAFTMYWSELFRQILPALISLQQLWSPRIYAMLSSNPSYEPVKRSIFGPSHMEGLKKCKLFSALSADDSRIAEMKAEHALKDQLYLVFGIFCKSFSVAGKQFILQPMLFSSTGGNVQQLVQQVIANAAFVEHNMFSLFMKYVVESLSISSFPSVRSAIIPFLTEIIQGIHKRLTFAWTGGPGVYSTTSTPEDNQYFLNLYHHCSIQSESVGLCLNSSGQTQEAPQFSADQILMVREAIIRETTNVVVDTLCIIFGIKGDLASSGNATISGGINPVANYVEARRNFLWSLYFGNSEDGNGLIEAIRLLLSSLLSVPDGVAVRQILLIMNVLLRKSESEFMHLQSFAAFDCFKIILKNLIHMESWSQGMEWDFVEYLLEAIKIHDLSHVDVPVGSNKSGGSNKKMDTWCGPKPKSNSHSIKSNGSIDGCFQILLSTGATTEQEIDDLKKQLIQSNTATKKSKGKQREVLRDFVTQLMQRIHGKDTLQASGSELAKKDPKVLDISVSSGATKRDKNYKPQSKKNYDNVGVDDLFDV